MIGFTLIIISLLNFTNLILGLPVVTLKISPRWGHSATLVNSNIYFIGGRTIGKVLETEFLSLDISKAFSGLQPEWTLHDTVGAPKVIGHTAVKGGLNNDQIIIFGGSVDDQATAVSNSLWLYDTISDTFKDPKVPKGPSRRYDHSAVSFPSGEMLIYGGLVDHTTGSEKKITSAELWELNTIKLDDWKGFIVKGNSPGLRSSHSALVIDNKMYLFGGVSGDIPLGMNVIYVFDLDKNIWQVNTASGRIPEPRKDYSAVAANKQIIIYGGTDAEQSVLYGDVTILDTTTWIWSTQDTKNPPPKRSGHSATLVGANMIVAFGMTEVSADSNIYILNIINWNWLTEYVPMDYPPDDGTPTTMKNITNPKPGSPRRTDDNAEFYLIIIIVLSVVCGLLFVVVISFIIYKLIDNYRIESGAYLVGIPYEANPEQPSPRPQQGRKKSRRLAFLRFNKNSKKNKHESAEVFFPSSIPTSPSSGQSTPHTTMTNRYSNGSGIGTMTNTNRFSTGSGVGTMTNINRFSNGSGVGTMTNTNRFSTGSGVGRVRFSATVDTISNFASFSDSEDSQIDVIREAEAIKGKLANNEPSLTPRPSVDDLAYTRTSVLRVVNPDEDGGEEEDDEEQEEIEEEDNEEEDQQGDDNEQVEDDEGEYQQEENDDNDGDDENGQESEVITHNA